MKRLKAIPVLGRHLNAISVLHGSIGIRLDQEGVLGSWLVSMNEAPKDDSRIRRKFEGDRQQAVVSRRQ